MPLFRDRVSKKPFIVGFDRDGSVLRATRRLLLSPPNRNKASRHKPFITRHKITSFSLLTSDKTLGDYFSPVMCFFGVFFHMFLFQVFFWGIFCGLAGCRFVAGD